MKFREYKNLNLVEICSEISAFWKDYKIFEQSVSSRSKNPRFVFFEGPPSANGLPGIHHVMSRLIKDIFCRYKLFNEIPAKTDYKYGYVVRGLVEKFIDLNETKNIPRI